MSRRLHWFVFLLFLAEQAVAAETRAPADDASASAMYSHGVHGYFSGNLNRAEMYLQRAAELSPNDPRPYYFRGLALMRLGRSGEAEAVFQQGAAIEASSPASANGIGEALARVQGADRLRLERARRQAQSNPTNSVADSRRLRSEQFERRQAIVLRKPIRMPLEALMNPIEPSQVAALSAAAEQEPVVATTAETPAAETTAVSGDVFEAANAGDPFADDPVEETASTEGTVPSGGGVKAGSMLGIFGRMGRKLGGNYVPGTDLVDKARGMIPGAGGGEVPPIMPEGSEGAPPGEGENSFGEAGENPSATPDGDPFATPEGTGETPEMPADGPTPPASDSDEDPFN